MTTVRIGYSPLAVDGGVNARFVPTRWAQRAANAAGFHLTVDGDAGPLTVSALRALNTRFGGGAPTPSVPGEHVWMVISKRLEDRLAALTYETTDTAPAITDPPPPAPPPAPAPPTGGGSGGQNPQTPHTDSVVTHDLVTDHPAEQPRTSGSILPWLALGALGIGAVAYLNRSGSVSGLGFSKGDPNRDWGDDPWRLVPVLLWPKLTKKAKIIGAGKGHPCRSSNPPTWCFTTEPGCKWVTMKGPLSAPNAIFHERMLGKQRPDGDWDTLHCQQSVLLALSERARKGKKR